MRQSTIHVKCKDHILIPISLFFIPVTARSGSLQPGEPRGSLGYHNPSLTSPLSVVALQSLVPTVPPCHDMVNGSGIFYSQWARFQAQPNSPEASNSSCRLSDRLFQFLGGSSQRFGNLRLWARIRRKIPIPVRKHPRNITIQFRPESGPRSLGAGGSTA